MNADLALLAMLGSLLAGALAWAIGAEGELHRAERERDALAEECRTLRAEVAAWRRRATRCVHATPSPARVGGDLTALCRLLGPREIPDGPEGDGV